MSYKTYLDKIINFCLYAVVFLAPVIFLPWTNYQLMWNKQFILIVLMLVAFLAWLVKGIIEGEFVYVKSFLNFILKGLVLVVLVGGLFSKAPYVGLLGLTGAEVSSFINILGFALLFFLLSVVNLDRKKLILIFLGSSFLVFLIGLLQISGVWIFPFEFTKSATFNTIGTTNAWSLFLGLLFVMLFSAAYGKQITEGHRSWKKLDWKEILAWTFLVVLLVIIFLLKFWPTFVGILLTALLFLFIKWRGQRKFNYKEMYAPLVLVVVSILIIYNYFLPGGWRFLPSLRIDKITIFNLPLEVTPSPSASWSVAKLSGQEGMKNFLIGTGGGTFQYQYGLYRSASLNDSDFWSVRFAQGFNGYLTHWVEWGILGMILWLLFLLFLFWEAFKAVISIHSEDSAIGIGLIYLIAVFFLYPQNFVLYFFIFVLGALLIGQEKKKKSIIISDGPARTFGFSLVLMIIILLTLGLTYLEGRRYLGSIYFYQATRAFNVEGNLDKAISKIDRATILDSWNDFYFQNSAQARLSQLNQIINQPTGGQGGLQKLQEKFTDSLGQAVNFGKKATELNPLESQNWFTLGQIYEAVAALVPGGAENAVNAYESALKLEPNSPLIVMALGRTHLVFGDFLKQKNDVNNAKREYDSGVAELEKAASLKANYLPAQLLLVKGYARQGKDLRVVQKSIEISTLLANNDPSIFYQLGLQLFQLEHLSEAKSYLEKAVDLFSDYSNARYYLGLTYWRGGQRAKAIEQFEKIVQLNPGRDDIKAAIDNLKNNRSIGAGEENPGLKEEPKKKRKK